MPLLALKELPRYDCLQEAAAEIPGMDVLSCEVFLHILRTGDGVSRAEGAFLSKHGLSHGRLVVLSLLEEAPDRILRSSELADLATVSRATMTGLLDALERDSYISRTVEPKDRRAVSIQITEKGVKLLEETMPQYLGWIAKTLSPFSIREKEQFVSLLKKLHTTFSSEPTL